MSFNDSLLSEQIASLKIVFPSAFIRVHPWFTLFSTA